jgi:hypothetical protein
MFIQNKYTKWYIDLINSAKMQVKHGYGEKHHIIPRCMGGSDAPENLVKLTAREHFICHKLLTKMIAKDSPYRSKLAYAAWQQGRSATNRGFKISSRIYESLKKELSESTIGRKRDPFSESARLNMRKSARQRKKYPPTEKQLKSYERLRELGQASAGTSKSEDTKKKISNKLSGRVLTTDHKTNISISKEGKTRDPFSDEWKKNMSNSKIGEKNNMFGKSHSEETKKLISLKKTGKPGSRKGAKLSESTKNKQSATKKNAPIVKCPHCGKEGRGSNMTRYHFDKCKLK